jgi:hypothetical protein
MDGYHNKLFLIYGFVVGLVEREEPGLFIWVIAIC